MSSIAFLLVFLLQGQPVASEQVELSADGNLKADKSRAYCGIYAAYGAASAVLKKIGREAICRISRSVLRQLCFKLLRKLYRRFAKSR